jgi:hypothetical protein
MDVVRRWPMSIVWILLAFLAVFALLAGLALWVRAAPGRSHAGPLPTVSPTQLATAERLEADVAILAASPRDVTHPEALKAAGDHIVARLTAAGLTPKRLPYQALGHPVENIEAVLPGGEKAHEVVVIGAHYDTVPGTHGADDNASGVAAMIELARRFQGRRFARTLHFVAFTNEEPPFFRTELMGSLVYARDLQDKKAGITAMISLEMLGFYSDAPKSQQYPVPALSAVYPDTANFVAFVGDLKNRDLVQRCVGVFRKAVPFPAESIAAPALMAGIDFSDHWAFWEAGFPAIMVTDTAFLRNHHYHAPTDLPETLDYPRMARLMDGLEAVAVDLLQQ